MTFARPLTLALFSLVAALPACAQTRARTVSGSELISRELPALRIRVDPAFRFAGSFPFAIRDVADGDRFVFVDADEGVVRRMVIAQFEAIRSTSDVRYNYSFEQAETIAGHRFRTNPFAWSNAAAAEENPAGEAALTVAFLAERGFRVADELMSVRWLTVPDSARMHELIVFYVEPLSSAGLRLDQVYDDEGATPAWQREAQALAQRAAAAFTIRPLG